MDVPAPKVSKNLLKMAFRSHFISSSWTSGKASCFQKTTSKLVKHSNLQLSPGIWTTSQIAPSFFLFAPALAPCWIITSFFEKCFSIRAEATCCFSAANKLLRISTLLKYFTYSWIFLNQSDWMELVGSMKFVFRGFFSDTSTSWLHVYISRMTNKFRKNNVERDVSDNGQRLTTVTLRIKEWEGMCNPQNKKHSKTCHSCSTHWLQILDIMLHTEKDRSYQPG